MNMTTDRQAGKTILVVEDDMATREALAMILSAEGYEVVSAGDGREALASLRGPSRPDLILLDLMMPIMDGWQFRREQAQDPTLSVIPVVVLSADGNVQQKATSLRAAGYLQKPVDLENLLEVIRKQL
jgi:CheY-like chemotaxis protein